jgi:signal transduction histidine kinase
MSPSKQIAPKPARAELRALVVEDCEDDALLLEAELEAIGFRVTSQRVECAGELRLALASKVWDIVLSDYSMPGFTALDALRIVHESSQAELPFVIVSGSIGEESAVAALKAGVSNYLMKGNLAQLKPVVDRELKDAQIRRERREAVAALDQAVSARDEFLSIASHELKTPVTTVGLQAEGLLRAARRERGPLLSNAVIVERIESIQSNVERLTHLIERLLDVTRAATGPLRLSLGRFDLVALVKRVLADMHETMCEVEVVAPERIEGRWDHDRIATVVGNLLSNAAKYGACRPVRVELVDHGDRVVLDVIDRGIGISAEHQQRIFERFERAVPERHYGGFGLGLWLAHKVIEAHGGTIALTSVAGQGSTFSVTLPKETPA